MAEGQLILGVSGIRGIVGEGITPAIVYRLVRAWADTVGSGAIVLGRDSRPSGQELQAAARAALMEVNRTVYDVGIVPTPTLGRAVRVLQAGAGLQITASHNPPQWNGMKMFTARGRGLPPKEAGALVARLRGIIHNGDTNASWLPTGKTVGASCEASSFSERVLDDHVAAVLSCVAVEPIRRRGFRVLVDANGGAGGPAALRLLRALGCSTVPIHCETDGVFRHEPEPTPASLQQVAPLVAQCACDVGFALDSDADRLVLLDESGQCLSEEITLALAVEARLRQGPGPVVVNLSTSLMVEELCRRRGLTCYRTPVGEAHVVDGILAQAAVIGGEGNGGVIEPRVGLVRDPLVAMALILELLAELQQPLSALAASLPRFVMRKDKMSLPQFKWTELQARLLRLLTAPQLDQRDGLYFRWPDRWIHIRPSNTEPVVRLIAESPTCSETDTLMQLAREALTTC
ncbi:MAG: phosphoglucosamine mutase [Gemmatales bacterium]|nr:phosphoglucosamine mutase [Gemmatales bacterium]MDW8176537.1 phosphoglucosamine mutase [Gemmatales bacterium]